MTYNRWVDKNQFEVMPFGKYSNDFEWRWNLSKGDFIDTCDTTNVWYNSFILKVAEIKNYSDKEIKRVHVGFQL